MHINITEFPTLTIKIVVGENIISDFYINSNGFKTTRPALIKTTPNF